MVVEWSTLQGDVQMSVSVLLVLGERAHGLVNEDQLVQWFSSYIGTQYTSLACVRVCSVTL